jgi:hypothetical protein
VASMLHARLHMRENRRQLIELLEPGALCEQQILWNPPMDAEYPPFFMLYMGCTDALEEELGLAPADVRAVFCAEGMCAERGFMPTHNDPAWRQLAEGIDLPYENSMRIYHRGVVIPNKFLRDPRFAGWVTEILGRMVAHSDRLRGIGEGIVEHYC